MEVLHKEEVDMHDYLSFYSPKLFDLQQQTIVKM
jgi:hypothetical protein